jgi:hypothetical protein
LVGYRFTGVTAALEGTHPMITIDHQRTAPPLPLLRRDIMHPMFKELFIDADDLAAEGDRQRRVRRSRRARPAMITRPAAGTRQNRPRS